MAFLIFSQSLSGSIFLSIADTVFTNKLRAWIDQFAPTVNPQIVINAGATGVRQVVSPQDLSGVLAAYAKSCDDVFFLAMAASAAAFLFAWGLGWTDIRKKKNNISNINNNNNNGHGRDGDDNGTVHNGHKEVGVGVGVEDIEAGFDVERADYIRDAAVAVADGLKTEVHAEAGAKEEHQEKA
jgi:hypothetical protein